MKTKSEISRVLDDIFLVWMENRSLTILNIFERARKEFDRSEGDWGEFSDLSDEDFLSLLWEFNNSQRNEKEDQGV
jgi:hypothetical protein